MPYSVSGCFDKFRREVVDLNPDQTKTARASRDFVLENIARLSDSGDLPKLAPDYCLFFGSFARNTKIRPLDDIDMMICYYGKGGVYDTILKNKKYQIKFEDGHPFFDDLRNDDGVTLNSRKVINQLIEALSGVEQYSKAEMHRRQEAATLKLKSYPWNFDIVPCFIAQEGFYLIPDGNGNWKNTDPRIDQKRVAEVNQKFGGKARQLVRLMKFWKQRAWGDSVSSYMFEQMVLNAIHSGNVNEDTWQEGVRDVLVYLVDAIRFPVPDPKGIQGDLNNIASVDRIVLSNKAQEDANTAILAHAKEVLGMTTDAIARWQIVFGSEFPDYGRD